MTGDIEEQLKLVLTPYRIRHIESEKQVTVSYLVQHLIARVVSGEVILVRLTQLIDHSPRRIISDRMMLQLTQDAVVLGRVLAHLPTSKGLCLVSVDRGGPVPGHWDHITQQSKVVLVIALRATTDPEGGMLHIAKSTPFPS